MCGIVGFYYPGGAPRDAKDILNGMTVAVSHRGPDDQGIYIDGHSRVGLGHRRLSIIDPSPAGHQPMHSASNNHVLVLNGEIYNHHLLRQSLADANLAPAWRGGSDTETLCAAIDAWGVAGALSKCIGMFALAVFCKQSQKLILARDRFGEKPLYYGWQSQGSGSEAVFIFGSELNAFRAHPEFQAQIDRDALRTFMQFGNVGGSSCIYKGVRKLEPGFMLTITGDSATHSSQAYWSSAEVASRLNGDAAMAKARPVDVIDEFGALLSNSVQQQMMSDVPYGAFLSGGIDSSLIVALMQSCTSVPINTFTVGFHEKNYNEANEAFMVAKHLGTNHQELYVSPEQVIDLVPQMGSIYDEPFADPSQIPTYLVSKLARNHVTVALSGDGADELFAGYNRHMIANKFGWFLSNISPRFSGFALDLFLDGPLASESGLLSILQRIPALKGVTSSLNVGRRRTHQIRELLNHRDFFEFYTNIISSWSQADSVVLGGGENSASAKSRPPLLSSKFSKVEEMMIYDVLAYLPDDVLTKVDRASMSVGLETRAPFLDHRIAEFSWRLPMRYKIRNQESKWILRQLLYRHVPRQLIDRPKMGFGAPIEIWLKGPLRDWAESLLDENRLIKEGFLNHRVVRQKWEEHVSEKKNWQNQLWNILMFQTWLDKHAAGLT